MREEEWMKGGGGQAGENPVVAAVTEERGEQTKGQENKKKWRKKCSKREPCDADGPRPCCAPSGWCGGSAAHCRCDACVNYGSKSSRTCENSSTVAPLSLQVGRAQYALLALCPQCEPGERFVPADKPQGKANVRDGAFDGCTLVGPVGARDVVKLPSVWRIDSYCFGNAPKLNFFYASTALRDDTNYANMFTLDSILKWPGQFIRPGSHAIDIGANVGDTTVPMAIFANHTIAFEAMPSIFQGIDAQSRLNPHLHIDAYNFALYEKDGTVRFQDGLSNAGIAQSQDAHVTGTRTVRAVEPMNFLSHKYSQEFLHNVSFIKIDTEGYDSTILRLLKPLLDSFPSDLKPLIQVEWYAQFRGCSGLKISKGSAELFRAIASLGYAAFGLNVKKGTTSRAPVVATCGKTYPDLMLYPLGTTPVQLPTVEELSLRWSHIG